MLCAKIKDEPENQMVSCKSSFAYAELNEKWCLRHSETFRSKPQTCPTGGNKCSQWGRHRGFIWSSRRVYREFM